MQTRNTNRRQFLFGAMALPLASGAVLLGKKAQAAQAPDTGTGPFKLEPLPYAFSALEPHIDARTMEIHWGKHHATYVKNLNDIATKEPSIAGKTPEYLVQNINAIPESVRTAIRNNGGGHYNHTLFWKLMKPNGGGEPTGALAEKIRADFGSFSAFQTQFNEAGTKRFGSGWVWLVRGRDGKLAIVSTPNQDNPLMDGQFPILGNDVWEHAYYLKYQNRRADYLKAWWNVVNWQAVGERFNSGRA